MEYQKIKARNLVRSSVVEQLDTVLFMEDLTVDYKEYGVGELKEGEPVFVASLTLGLRVGNVDVLCTDPLIFDKNLVKAYSELLSDLTHTVYNYFIFDYYVIPNGDLEPTVGYRVRIAGTEDLKPLSKIPDDYAEYFVGNHWGMVTSSRQSIAVNVLLKSMYAAFNWSSKRNNGIVLVKLFIEGTDEFSDDIFAHHTPKKSFLDKEPNKLTYGYISNGNTVTDRVVKYRGNYNNVLEDLLLRYQKEKSHAKIEEYHLYKVR